MYFSKEMTEKARAVIAGEIDIPCPIGWHTLYESNVLCAYACTLLRMPGAGMDEDAIQKQSMEPALKQVRMDLAVSAIVKAENLEASDEEVENEMKTIAEKYGMDLESIKKYLPASDVKEQVIREKVIKVVADSAKAVAPAEEKAELEAEGEIVEKPAKKPAAKKTTKKAEGEEKAEKAPAKKSAAKKTAKKDAE